MTKRVVPKPQPQPSKTREQLMTERALADDAAMTAANTKPFDLGLLAPEDWMHKGGNCGFKLNGFSIVRRR